MEILRFAKWWWNKLDVSERVLLLFTSWTLFIPINIYFTTFGIAIATYFAGLGLAGLCYIAFVAYKGIERRWAEYKRVKEDEADRIVRRLQRGYE